MTPNGGANALLVDRQRKSIREIRAMPNKDTRRYYATQNELLDLFEEAEEHLQRYGRKSEKIEHAVSDAIDAAADGAIPMQQRESAQEAHSELGDGDSDTDPSAFPLTIRLAISCSFFANIVLFALKLVVTVQSGSLSVLASASMARVCSIE